MAELHHCDYVSSSEKKYWLGYLRPSECADCIFDLCTSEQWCGRWFIWWVDKGALSGILMEVF